MSLAGSSTTLAPDLRLAVITTHPVQYYAPLFRTLADRVNLHVFYSHIATPSQQAAAGFGTAFDWDIDLMHGYRSTLLKNVAAVAETGRFAGCDTPEIGARLSEGKFDAILSLGWHSKSLIQAIVAAKRIGIPVMVRGDSQLGLQPSRLKRAIKRVAYPVLLRFFDAALVVGTRNREYFRHYSYPARRMFLSPHAVDTEFFAQRATSEARNTFRQDIGIARDTRVVLFAGKLLDFKRPLDVVEAIARLRSEGLDLAMMVAGSGPMDSMLRAKAMDLAVPLHSLGFVNQTLMPTVYAAADVLSLPSSSETWGLVANEALACGIPIVVSDVAGCAPDLCDGKAGLTHDCGDLAGLADALRTMIVGPIDKTAIAMVSNAHSLERAADGIVEAAEAVARQSKWA